MREPTGYFNQRAGFMGSPYAPAPPATAPTTQLGSQTNPLGAFFGAGGATGNKTTNKDLPQWLRDLGMKGDAYAGGMLKPELRYGFKYKDGQIHFADGTSFAATKNKGGTYSYTDANGQATTYSPTDEQNEYNKAYKASTSNQSFLDKAKNTIDFELWHGKQILKGIGDNPLQSAFFGIDPIGTKIGNAVTGNDAKPLVDQLGGANSSRYDEYGSPTGYAKPLQGAAHVVAAAYGANGLMGIGGGAPAAGGGTGSSGTSGATGWGGPGTGGFDGTFSAGGLGGGNAGQLAAAGGIGGGAGTGIGGSLGGGSGFLSQGAIGNVAQLQGMFGGGDQGGGQPQIPYVQPMLGNQMQPQQRQSAQFIGLPTQTQMPYIPTRGYNAHDFFGSTVWT